jgi:hypothetical protein
VLERLLKQNDGDEDVKRILSLFRHGFCWNSVEIRSLVLEFLGSQGGNLLVNQGECGGSQGTGGAKGVRVRMRVEERGGESEGVRAREREREKERERGW